MNEEDAHRSVVATIEGRRILVDAGFPLPVVVPLDAPGTEIPTGFGTLTVADSRRVTCDARGEVTDLLRLNPGARPERASAPFALRVLDDRVLCWAGGAMSILDAWSVLRYPLAGTERAALESLFALNLDGVGPPAVPAASLAPSLTVFHSVALAPEDVRRGLALSELPPSSLVASRDAAVEAAPGGARIALRAALGGRVPPAGPGESVRKTLVFHLAMDLLGLGSAPG